MYISCCIFECCCFLFCCFCGQSPHVSLCRCVCFVVCSVYPKHQICASLHRTTTRQAVLQYVSTSMSGNLNRWRPYRVECTGSLPTSEVKRRRARLVLGWGTAREDLRVLPDYVHLPLLCLSASVVNPCADDLYISCCMFSECCFGCCCDCGQSLHVSMWLCVFVCCCLHWEPKQHPRVPICIEQPNSKHFQQNTRLGAHPGPKGVSQETNVAEIWKS